MSAFSIFVPAGWQLIDLAGDLPDQSDRAVVHLTSGLPVAQAAATARAVKARLIPALRDLSGAGGLGFLLPVDSLLSQPVRPSMLVRAFDPPAGVSPLEALVGLAASSARAELMDIEHLVALRIAADTSSVMAAGAVSPLLAELEVAAQTDAAAMRLLAEPLARRTHHVRYILGSPSEDAPWAELLASVTVDDDAAGAVLADAVLPLFDELARSFRWAEAAA